MTEKGRHNSSHSGNHAVKDKMLVVRDFIVAKGKIVFPVLLVAVVAITVLVALNIRDKKAEEVPVPETMQATTTAGEADTGVQVPDVPLELDKYPEINTLIYTYYDALANGNVDAIAAISNIMEDTEKIRTQELGKYIEWYPTIEIYTKPGPEANSYLAFASTKVTFNGFADEVAGFETFYICTDENGNVYLNEGEVDQAITDYINVVIFQEDVVDLYNKVNAEYNETIMANPDLFAYVSEMEQDIRVSVGIALAEQEAAANPEPAVPEQSENTLPAENEAGDTQAPAATGPATATATTTVNVRSSDSETADKLGKVTGGTKVQVLEQKANGWSKISFEGAEGYIKSEFLQVAESASGTETIGTVTAAENVNVRASASETAEKLGVLAGGESVELVANENDWCKIVYNGQIGYVKAQYVQ